MPLGVSTMCVLLGGTFLVRWRYRLRKRTGKAGASPFSTPALAAESEKPKASLGTPDVLVLTPATTEDDRRLHDRLAQQADAIFTNVQLACSFYPTEEWAFNGARLTVALARGDGKQAPAPIAYSLRPLSGQDDTARESTAEIGADVKFVNVRAGEKTTRSGDVFVRGYGLQESTSYWEFTPTKERPLDGSFWLWLIAKAPLETDLALTSSLQVRAAPRHRWTRGDSPPVENVGEVGLVLHLKDGPPYRVEGVPASDLRHQRGD